MAAQANEDNEEFIEHKAWSLASMNLTNNTNKTR